MKSILLLTVAIAINAQDMDISKVALSTAGNAFTATPIYETVDADVVVVPVSVICHEDDLNRRLELKKSGEQKVIEILSKSTSYKVASAGNYTHWEQAVSSLFSTANALPEAQIWVVKTGPQDADKMEIEIRKVLQDAKVAKCQVAVQEFRLALLDSERFRPELISKITKFVDLNRSAAPRDARATVSGLERPIAVWASAMEGKVVITLPFTVAFEEK